MAAVLVTGLNLRAAITAVGVVLPEVRADLRLSAVAAGLLTTLPVLCFAVLAPGAAALGRALGPRRAVLAGLLLLGVATAARPLGGAPLLIAGTVVVGAAVTVGNVLVPVVVKGRLGARAGRVTGLYTAAIAAGAAAGAAVTAPLAGVWGWRAALVAGAVPALVAALVWWRAVPDAAPAPPARAGRVRVWRSRLAWAVAGVLALHSLLYYAVTTWLPTLLVDRGTGAGAAAGAAALFQVLGLAGTLVVPLLAGRPAGERGLGVVVGAAWAALPAGLLLAPQVWPVWVVAGGLAQGAGIALAFTLVVLRSADEPAARELSGMTQAVGYAVGAAGPLLVGALRTATGTWAVPLVLLAVAAAGLAAAAAYAGRPVRLGAG